METVEEIRRKNLAMLRQEAKDNGSAVTDNDFADSIGASKSYYNQIKSGASNIASNKARELEKLLRLESGWLDHTQYDECLAPAEKSNNVIPIRPDIIQIPHLSTVAGMGANVSVDLDHDSLISTLEVTRGYMKETLASFSKPENIKLINVIGDSMEGVFAPNDTLFVDTGINSFLTEGKYVVHHDESIWVKIIQRDGNGGFIIKSANPIYDPVSVKKDDPSFKIVGMVVGVLNYKKIV